MKESIFSKVYSYREKEGSNSKENFLTEILAHCLQTDKKFLNNFLDQLNISSNLESQIKTQPLYEFGKPDIEINLPAKKICILIECKIEHLERLNQLEDYKKILEQKKINKRHLIYLTKYYIHKDNNNNNVILHLKKWSDIFQIIDENNSVLTQELKLYLKEQNMSESNNLTYSDLSVLTNITSTISKMDEVIDGISEYYIDKIGPLDKRSARSTRISDSESYTTRNYSEKRNKYISYIEIGFYWWDSEDVFIGVSIWLKESDKYNDAPKIFKTLKQQLRTWEIIDTDDAFQIAKLEHVSKFISEEDEQIPAMISFLKKCVDDLLKIKKIEPRIFKHGFVN